MERSLSAFSTGPRTTLSEFPFAFPFRWSREIRSCRSEVMPRIFSSRRTRGNVARDGADHVPCARDVVHASAVSTCPCAFSIAVRGPTGRVARDVPHVGCGTAAGSIRRAHQGERARASRRPPRLAAACNAGAPDSRPCEDIARGREAAQRGRAARTDSEDGGRGRPSGAVTIASGGDAGSDCGAVREACQGLNAAVASGHAER